MNQYLFVFYILRMHSLKVCDFSVLDIISWLYFKRGLDSVLTRLCLERIWAGLLFLDIPLSGDLFFF